jgi:hypothetical protein
VYAQLVRSRTTDRKCAEVDRIVADELIPALRNQPGFAGALSLVNACTGETIMIVLWHSAEQAQRPLGADGTDVLAPLLPVAGTSPGDHQSTSFWEVTVRV